MEKEKIIKLLADWQEVDKSEITVSSYDESLFEFEDGSSYSVYTDEQAEDVASDYIKMTLWTFNPSFLAEVTNLPVEVFEELAKSCESSNGAIESLIERLSDMDELVQTAIAYDGRGAFVSNYDGEETRLGYTDYYAYRQD